jgi:hypothetical protein
MSQPVRPEVSDPKLRAVLDRVGPNIENYHVNLDAISNNIRAIVRVPQRTNAGERCPP